MALTNGNTRKMGIKDRLHAIPPSALPRSLPCDRRPSGSQATRCRCQARARPCRIARWSCERSGNMATTAVAATQSARQRNIEILSRRGFYDPKTAVETAIGDKNRVTRACVQSLGFSESGSRIELTWRPPNKATSKEYFDIFDGSGAHDVEFNTRTMEKMLELKRGADSAFPVVKKHQSKGEYLLSLYA